MWGSWGRGSSGLPSFHRIRLERYLAVSPRALRSLRTQMEEVILAYQAEQEQQIGQTARRVPLIAGADETFFERVILVTPQSQLLGLIVGQDGPRLIMEPASQMPLNRVI